MNSISVQKRDKSLKPKQLRRTGFVPGSIFGGGLQRSIDIQIMEPTARKLIQTLRLGSKLELELEGKTYPVQIKEKNMGILNNEIMHLSFQVLREGQKVNSVIHIILKNAELVADTLERMQLEVPYLSLPKDMIDTITVDLDGAKLGTVCTLADIPELQSEKIELLLPRDTVVFRLRGRRSASSRPEVKE